MLTTVEIPILKIRQSHKCLVLIIKISISGKMVLILKQDPGQWFNIKMLSYQYRKSHCGDKTILQPSYLHNGVLVRWHIHIETGPKSLPPSIVSCWHEGWSCLLHHSGLSTFMPHKPEGPSHYSNKINIITWILPINHSPIYTDR